MCVPGGSGWPSVDQDDLLRPDGDPVAVALDQVGDADEPGHEVGPRPLVDLDRRPDLLDPALVQHRDAVAHRQRLFLVVRDVDERDADLALDPQQLELHLLAELEVKRAERLVKQQHLRLVDDRPGERDPLALAAGQLGRLAAAEPGQPDHLERAGRPSLAAAALGTCRTRRPYSMFSATVMCGNSA